MSRTGLIYRNGSAYELAMRVIYGRHYSERMRLVAAEVPSGSSVLELCCGPGTLYRRYLRSRTSAYVGLDINEEFVRELRAEGVDARQVDLKTLSDPLPRADVVLMQDSLYNFLPAAEEIVDRMLAAALHRTIICETIHRRFESDHGLRFTEQTLDAVMSRCSHQVVRSFLIAGGRDKVYVLRSD